MTAAVGTAKLGGMSGVRVIEKLEPGTQILFGGDKFVRVSAELAAAFQPGDQVRIIEQTGELLHVPAAELAIARAAVDRAYAAFGRS